MIDHLCAVSLLSEEGYDIVDAEQALFFNEGKEKLAKKFLKVSYGSMVVLRVCNLFIIEIAISFP